MLTEVVEVLTGDIRAYHEHRRDTHKQEYVVQKQKQAMRAKNLNEQTLAMEDLYQEGVDVSMIAIALESNDEMTKTNIG